MYTWLVESSGDGLSSVILAYLKTAFELRKLYRLFREEVTKLILRELRYISVSHIHSACGVIHIQIYRVTKVIGTYIYCIINV
jgi:hypothetical protein